MFTGIVEAIGEAQALDSRGDSARLRIAFPGRFGPLQIGESVAINGACLTVEETSQHSFVASLSGETLARTTLASLSPGTKLNLERAMALGGRLGGHLVTGHIDATGRIRSLARQGEWWELAVEAPEPILRLCVEKGSVAVDGISLTIASLAPWGFSAAIIPHTYENTTLRGRRAGDEVNLEADLIAKHVARLLEPLQGKPESVTWETLKKAGFL